MEKEVEKLAESLRKSGLASGEEDALLKAEQMLKKDIPETQKQAEPATLKAEEKPVENSPEQEKTAETPQKEESKPSKREEADLNKFFSANK